MSSRGVSNDFRLDVGLFVFRGGVVEGLGVGGRLGFNVGGSVDRRTVGGELGGCVEGSDGFGLGGNDGFVGDLED